MQDVNHGSWQYFHYDNSLDEMDIEIDGARTRVALGSVVSAANSFLIPRFYGRRVNVIGFREPGETYWKQPVDL